MHYCRCPVYAVVVGRTSRLSFLPSSGWISATPDGFCSLDTDFRTFKTPFENLAPDPLSVGYKGKPSISVPHVCRSRSRGTKIWLWYCCDMDDWGFLLFLSVLGPLLGNQTQENVTVWALVLVFPELIQMIGSEPSFICAMLHHIFWVHLWSLLKFTKLFWFAAHIILL